MVFSLSLSPKEDHKANLKETDKNFLKGVISSQRMWWFSGKNVEIPNMPSRWQYLFRDQATGTLLRLDFVNLIASWLFITVSALPLFLTGWFCISADYKKRNHAISIIPDYIFLGHALSIIYWFHQQRFSSQRVYQQNGEEWLFFPSNSAK